jgi:hypothetical protein
MKVFRLVSMVLVLGICVAGTSFGQKTPQYGGARPCKGCHMNPKFGNQFGKWEKGPHAGAFVTLGTDEAKAVGKKLGVDDPQKADQCLKCHVTSAGKDAKLVARTAKEAEGVQCESCHGPGSLYRNPSVMNAKKYQADPAGTLEIWKSLGLIVPDEKVCVTCHNEESPTFKPFKFAERAAEIAHPNPTKKH